MKSSMSHMAERRGPTRGKRKHGSVNVRGVERSKVRKIK